jgi:hypothetical protein
MNDDPLLRFRPEFPILERTTYLISSSLGAGIRLSPHFHTADEEVDRAFDVIDEIRASGAWQRWSDRPTVVP